MEPQKCRMRVNIIRELAEQLQKKRKEKVPSGELGILLGAAFALIEKWQLNAPYYDPSMGRSPNLQKHFEELAGLADSKDNIHEIDDIMQDIIADLTAYAQNYGCPNLFE